MWQNLLCIDWAKHNNVWLTVSHPYIIHALHSINSLQFYLILLVTFDVSSLQWGWYNCTKVYHPNYINEVRGKISYGFQLSNNWFGLGTSSLFRVCLWICIQHFFFGGWHLWVWSSSVDLMVVNNSCNFGFVSIICLRVGNYVLGHSL